MDETNAKFRVLLGMIYHQTNLLDKAMEQFELAQKLDPTSSGAVGNQASLYYDQGRLTDAENTYRKAVDLEPNYAPMLYK